MLRPLAVTACIAALAAGVVACGDDDAPSAAPAAAKPAPIAQIDALSARSTEVALDAGFVDALGSLELAPAALGDGRITKAGVARFPSRAATSRTTSPARSPHSCRARSTTTAAG